MSRFFILVGPFAHLFEEPEKNPAIIRLKNLDDEISTKREEVLLCDSISLVDFYKPKDFILKFDNSPN